ncbi:MULTISPECIES: ATP-binding protein [Streptomyces]|uniref:ATP-binding protein n=1 Tax=Streptomyces griseoaurantiacus TaxID=68213 RepID=A0ABZ1V3T5_9ACTN|nr:MULTISPECIES: ATP-binding protein [Streptomyces]MDX3090431.1 ATP-binding protein [Streptomyces sp. ME12-02E]MDX3330466.1 ATP-binding protein [Streptomyces sp. ME02-6978a]MDX3360635.1 ATP-binding protein [Streptomyces sp. ME02-6978.2a]WTI27201.1 ATP-binding protein [Streptomyces jietaisiensis]
MSTTRPYSPGDRGPEPSGASGAAADATASSEGPSSVPSASSASADPPGGGASPAAAPSGSPPSGGRQVRRLNFDGASGVVPLARDFTRQALYAWGWLPADSADQRAAAEDVLLVVSELVTNACLHAEGPEELWITCDNKVLRIEVSDRGEGQPAPRTPHRAGRPGGHGMFIVERLCLDWGVVRSKDAGGPAGKTVWAELGAP